MEKNYTFLSMIKKYVSSSVLLIIATVLALIVANVPATKEWYQNVWQEEVRLSIGSLNLFSHGGHPLTLGAFINDFLMAIFFLSVGLELKREIFCGGELSTVKKALLPVIGAIGGMIMPVVVFFLFLHTIPGGGDIDVMERGLPIPMATDIAFSLGVLSMFSKRVPMGLKVFLAALAVADDLGGIIVIAVKYTDHISLAHLLGAFACAGACYVCGKFKVRNKLTYFLIGTMMWWFMLNSGIHATIAGVMLAFCVPARLDYGTKYYIEKIRWLVDKFPHYEVTAADKKTPVMLKDSDLQDLRSIESASDRLISVLQDMEDVLANPINYVIIPIFAFANAGVCFDGMSIMNLFQGVGLGVFAGLLIGKFTGVFSASWISIKMHLVDMPENTTWPAMAGVAMLCGIGFTVSMFMSALSYPVDMEVAGMGPDYMRCLLNDAKLGILCGTVASAAFGMIILNWALPKGKE